jgi:Peptidase inhibitor I78 family
VRYFPPIAIFLLSTVITGCVPKADAGRVSSNAEAAGQAVLCNSSKLDHYIGASLTRDLGEHMKKEAGASILRVAPHDGVITMDYSPSRLNIFIDKAQIIIRINCG